jgi:hypothetical protein
VSVDPLGPVDLDSLQRELVDRAGAARAAASALLPEARPSAENCKYCAVRQMCQEYWKPETQAAIGAALMEPSAFMDVELAIAGRHGAASWDGVVGASRSAAPGRKLLLRTGHTELSLKPNDRVRVIDAHVTVPDDATR